MRWMFGVSMEWVASSERFALDFSRTTPSMLPSRTACSSEEQAVRDGSIDGVVREKSKAKRSDDATHPMDTPNIQRIVPASFSLIFHSNETTDGCNDADDGRGIYIDITRSRRNGGQTSHSTSHQPHEGRFFLPRVPFNQQPSHSRKRCSSIG